MKKKWLGITLALLVVVVAAVAAVVTLGDTKVEAADAPVVSLDKTEYAYGEKLQISWSGLTDEWRTANIEMRIDKGHDLSDTMTDVGDFDYFYMQKGTNDKVKGESGTATYPDDFVRNTDMTPGKYTLWIFRYTPRKAISERIEFNVYPTLISTEKTTFAFGEEIKVTHGDLPARFFANGAKTTDSELLIYQYGRWYYANNCPYGYYDDYETSGSMMYAELGIGSNAYSESDYASGSVPSATVTFPGARDGGLYSDITKLLPGKYRIVATYNPTTDKANVIHRASNVIEIEILAPELSISKDQLGYGEDATVSWKNVGPYLRGSSYVEIGLFKKGNIVGTNTNLKYKVVWNATTSTSTSGSFSLKSGMTKGVMNADAILEPGDYFLALRTGYYANGNNNTCTVGTVIVNFTVHSPEIQLAKDTFAYGEGITLTYKYCTEQWLLDNKNQSYLSIDVFHKGYGQAANADKGIAARQTEQEHVIFHVTPTVAQSNLTEATITFPYDDNDKKAQRFPFEPGEYRVIVRLGGKQLNETEYTFTVEEPVFKIQPELNDSISMHFSVLMGDDIFGIDTLVRNPMLKISFNNDVVENRNYTKELDSETGLYWYTFTYDNVLPQQMMDFFAAELFIEGPVFDYTKFANANSVSVRKISNYSIRTYADNALENADYADAHDLIVAMLNYGAEAQKYFDYNAENLANAGLEKEIVNAPITDATSVVAVNGACAEGYAWKAVTLDLQSKLGFRLKFTAADLSKVTISCNGVSYTAETHVDQFASAGKGMYYFYLEGITANAFNTPYEISLTVDGMTSTVTYSVNSYIDYISTKDNTELTDICTAIYNYGLLAANYR